MHHLLTHLGDFFNFLTISHCFISAIWCKVAHSCNYLSKMLIRLPEFLLGAMQDLQLLVTLGSAHKGKECTHVLFSFCFTLGCLEGVTLTLTCDFFEETFLFFFGVLHLPMMNQYYRMIGNVNYEIQIYVIICLAAIGYM